MEDIFHTRREFIKHGLALLSASATIPCFLDQTAWAMGDPSDRFRPRGADDRILVVLQLAGGNDGLNTLIPFANDLYYKARPRLAIAKNSALKLTDQLGLHSSAEGLKQLYDDGHLAIIQGVGYPNPDRSHFVSTDIWATADPNGRAHEGWLGRYFDCTCKGTDRPNPRLGIVLTTESPLALSGKQFTPISFGSPDELTWRGADGASKRTQAFDRLNSASEPATGKLTPQARALAYLQRTAMDARAGAREIQEAAGGTGARFARRAGRPASGKGRGSGQLAQQLMMVQRMIAAGLETRVYYVTLGGFDTHANQANRHQQLMIELGDALAQFVAELKKDGLLDRVLLVTFSEFGRRVAENASQGTDHGTAAPLFVVGSRIQPGVHGPHPSLEPAKLDQGDLKWQIDFRSIYAGVLKDWLKTDPGRILGGQFRPLDFLRA